MAPFVEDSFLSTLFDPASAAMPSDTPSFVGDHHYYDSLFSMQQPQSSFLTVNAPASSSSSSMCMTRPSLTLSPTTDLPATALSPNYAAAAAAAAAAADWSDLPSDMVESLVNYLSNDDGSSASLSGSPITSPDSMFGGASISPTFALNDWWSSIPFDNASSTNHHIDNFGVVPTSAFTVARAQPQQQQQQQQHAQTLLQVPQFSTQPPLPSSPVIHNDISPVLSSTFRGKTDDMPLVEPLRGKRVSFKLTADADAEILSNKEFYARIREPEVCEMLVRKVHPVFSSLDDAVGSFYILKDVRARKPPLIDAEKFNCHTRRDAGDAHWQYNVPGTDFTCRVTQWEMQTSEVKSTTYTSYHYYRSPTPRRGTSRYSPY